MREPPSASGVPTRTILPERHFPPRAVSAGAFSASSGRTPSGTAGRARRTVFSASSGRTAPPWPATAAARVFSASSGHAAPSSRQAGRLLRARGQRLIGSFLSESRNAAPARPGAARTGPGAGVLAVAAVRAGPAAAQVVQICHKGLDLAGAPKGNRRYSALLLAADPAAAEVMGWSRSPTSGESLGVGCAAGSWPAAPGSAEGASGRLLRAFLSAALLHPPLRPFFSYSEGSRSVAEEEGRSRRECRRAARTRITAR